MEYSEGFEDICDYVDKHGFIPELSAKTFYLSMQKSFQVLHKPPFERLVKMCLF